ncbi:MAG: hypothetical protein RTU30_12810 [Candidatus Thorarchaeota archaeon]
MKLEDIESGKNVTEVVVRVMSKAPPRIITTRSGRKTQLTEVLIADETMSVILSLWGFGEGSKILVGKVIKILNGWAKEWQGQIQLSLGKAGTFEEMDDDGSVPSITDLRTMLERERTPAS